MKQTSIFKSTYTFLSLLFCSKANSWGPEEKRGERRKERGRQEDNAPTEETWCQRTYGEQRQTKREESVEWKQKSILWDSTEPIARYSSELFSPSVSTRRACWDFPIKLGKRRTTIVRDTCQSCVEEVQKDTVVLRNTNICSQMVIVSCWGILCLFLWSQMVIVSCMGNLCLFLWSQMVIVSCWGICVCFCEVRWWSSVVGEFVFSFCAVRWWSSKFMRKLWLLC